MEIFSIIRIQHDEIEMLRCQAEDDADSIRLLQQRNNELYQRQRQLEY